MKCARIWMPLTAAIYVADVSAVSLGRAGFDAGMWFIWNKGLSGSRPQAGKSVCAELAGMHAAHVHAHLTFIEHLLCAEVNEILQYLVSASLHNVDS